MYRVWDNISPTKEEVIRWAYDDNLLFTDQDEDLILYSTTYSSVLMELACTSDCPKNDYCLSILSNYSKKVLCDRDIESIFLIAKSIKEIKVNLTAPCLAWVKNFTLCQSLVESPRKIALKESESVAHFLLSVDTGLADIKNLGKMSSSAIIEYMKLGVYQDYLYINLDNGFWRLSKFKRLTDA